MNVGLNKSFLVPLCIAGIIASANLRAGPISLESSEVLQLRGLISTNAAAAEQFAILRKTADKALGTKPDPIENVISEGHLQKDPLKIRSRAAMARPHQNLRSGVGMDDHGRRASILPPRLANTF